MINMNSINKNNENLRKSSLDSFNNANIDYK